MCSGECGNEYVVEEEKTKEEIKTIIIYLQKGDMYEVAQ